MTLGEKLKYLRKQKNITQTQFADMLYVTRQAVQKWESDLSAPDLSKLPDISKMLGISIDMLLDESVDETALIRELTKGDSTQEQTIVSSAKSRSMLDYLLMIPIGLGVAVVIGMAYVMGAIAVGLLFGVAVGSIGYGLFSIVNIFLNASIGTGAILISVSFALIGIGISYPAYLLGRWWLAKYLALIPKLNGLVRRLVKGVRL